MGKKILTVDDSRTIRDMVAYTLSKEGYEIAEAEDGQVALNNLTQGSLQVDLIITDINMPNMDGLTLVRNLRALPSFKTIPILVLTTEGDDAKKMEGRNAGATGWIVKPFVPEKLVEVVRKVCPAAA